MRMKILYMTKTGHSRKIAEELGAALHAEVVNGKDRPELKGTDLLVIVGGIYAGKSNPELVEYLRGVDNTVVRKAALVTSCASRKFFQKEVRAALVANGIEVFPEEQVCWGSFLIYGWGHPNQQDFIDAANFVKRVVELS